MRGLSCERQENFSRVDDETPLHRAIGQSGID